MQITRTNEQFIGAENKSSLYDLIVPNNFNGNLIIFVHGYMGYKDWGCWNLVAEYFTQLGYGFLKYNASHNGGTVQNPIDFDDLESFSKNSYSKEIYDFEAILSVTDSIPVQLDKTFIIGHSRGGAIALLQSNNSKVDKICTWAAVCSLEDRFPSGPALENWKNEGVYHRENGRTKQLMPHSYNQYVEFLANRDRLNIKEYCESSQVPICAIHGDNDTSVSMQDGRNISRWSGSELIVIENTQHTFDSSQPWTSKEMPDALRTVCDKTHDFFSNKES